MVNFYEEYWWIKHKQTPHIHGFLDKSTSETYIDNKISERMQCMKHASLNQFQWDFKLEQNYNETNFVQIVGVGLSHYSFPLNIQIS